MSGGERVVLLVASDGELTRRLISEMLGFGERYQLPIAASLEQARFRIQQVRPAVILLDESAVRRSSLASAARALLQEAPVVVVAAPQRHEELAPLAAEGGVDVVARAGKFVPMAAALLRRRMNQAERAAAFALAQESEMGGLPPDFAEVLRHEVNNPLTGVLGNAELLLARRNRLPAFAVQRLETIAELAVRLRETVRRLTSLWEEQQARVHSA